MHHVDAKSSKNEKMEFYQIITINKSDLTFIKSIYFHLSFWCQDHTLASHLYKQHNKFYLVKVNLKIDPDCIYKIYTHRRRGREREWGREEHLVVTRPKWREVHGALKKTWNSSLSSKSLVMRTGDLFPNNLVCCCFLIMIKAKPIEWLFLICFWIKMQNNEGLLRCGKSCRLRWINYLRPDVKRGNFTAEEEETIIKLHQNYGNK